MRLNEFLPNLYCLFLPVRMSSFYTSPCVFPMRQDIETVLAELHMISWPKTFILKIFLYLALSPSCGYRADVASGAMNLLTLLKGHP